MIKLEFKDKHGVLTDLGDFETEEIAWQFMRVFISANRLPKMHYARMWEVEEGRVQIDYGSHVSFFFMTLLDNE